jgi:hypothetical protein
MTFGTRSFLAALALALLALGLGTANARAAGGNYVFDGGTVDQRTQVRKALDASAFPWGVVATQVTIHVSAGHNSEATPGEIWLDASLLDSGKFAWGVVQHEYAHQVDFALFNDAIRSRLLAKVGGSSWWSLPGLGHAKLGSERFASTLAWAYWPSPANSMKPQSKRDESAAMAPAAFRQLVDQVVAPAPLAVK